MCLLVAYRSGAMPDPSALSRATSRNPDGFGWAIVVGDEIVTYRTLDPSDGVSSFVSARAKYPDGPALWHARFTTHGASDLTNVHPFPVNGDPRIVVAHNGVLPVDPTGTRSDTHEFALSMLRADDLDNASAMYWLSAWAEGSKLVVLSASPETSERLYFVNESAGKWSDDEPGVWYSNASHAPYVAPSFSADPRRSKTSASDRLALAWGAIPDDDDDDDLDGPWAFYNGGPMVECECGTMWPDFCSWCDDCGLSLSSDDREFAWGEL